MDLVQQDLFATTSAMSVDELTVFLSRDWSKTLHIKTTRNRVTMLTVDFKPNETVHLRLHEQFLQAPIGVLEAIRRYIRTRRRKHWHVISEYAQSIQTAATTRPVRTRPQGHLYDLEAIQREINRRFFNGKIRCKITWGREPNSNRRKRCRSIAFGSYSDELNLVRVNPLLDDERVPRAFVEFIVYHEMLHALVPSTKRNGRWNHHPPQFKRLERQFPDWDEMQKLSKKLLHMLT